MARAVFARFSGCCARLRMCAVTFNAYDHDNDGVLNRVRAHAGRPHTRGDVNVDALVVCPLRWLGRASTTVHPGEQLLAAVRGQLQDRHG